MNCDKCGRFHDHGLGSAWKMVYSGGPIPMPDREITRCQACVEKHGPFQAQYGIKPEYSCGIVSHNKPVEPTAGKSPQSEELFNPNKIYVGDKAI